MRSVYRMLLAGIILAQSGHALAIELGEMQYHDALEFSLINKGWDYTKTPYTLLPESDEISSRAGLRTVVENSAGIGVRFATDSRAIGVRYILTKNFHMNHMADTGTKGTDLYIRHDDGTWHFVATSIPGKNAENNKKYVDNMDGKMHEYIIYLPLYDGIQKLEIGVDPKSTITKPQVNSPRSDQKVVFYGTSITQGGCATRTGMVATNILQRQLDVEVVNLGFSGQGRLDLFVAKDMAQIHEAIAYVLDVVPNCKTGQIDSLCVDFVDILLKGNPKAAVFLVEGHIYSYEPYDYKQQEKMHETNEMLHRKFLELKARYPDNVFYIDRDNLVGPDGEGTVGGAHFTDYGFTLYANRLRPYLDAVLLGGTIPMQEYVCDLYNK